MLITALHHFLIHRPESGEPSSYETRPFLPSGLPDDDLERALLVRFGDWESSEDRDSEALLLQEGDLRLSFLGETRDLEISTGEWLWMGL